MHDAVAELLRDGDTVALEGFTHLIPFAAGHEIIRQRRRDLTLVRMTPDIIFDQMIAAGVARRMIFAFMGNSAVGSLHAIRRRIENQDPAPLEIDEYSHYGMLGRYIAGASGLPFFPVRSYTGSDLLRVNSNIRRIISPFDDATELFAVPPLRPDLAIIHAQRADVVGNTQIWGIVGAQQETAFAAKRTIVVVEEIVDEMVIRSDPNRTLIPAFAVDAVVCCPHGAHPSYAQGYYDRDGDFYQRWPSISREPAKLDAWLDDWVYSLADHRDYLAKLGDEHWNALTPDTALSSPVSYGRYA